MTEPALVLLVCGARGVVRSARVIGDPEAAVLNDVLPSCLAWLAGPAATLAAVVPVAVVLIGPDHHDRWSTT